jgi:RNA polymerase sigma factor (sigma-70 family)
MSIEREDFAEFFRSEFPRLVRAMFVVCGSMAEAEEVAQDAMAKVCERWLAGAELRSPARYLYAVALNTARRRAWRHRLARRFALQRSPSSTEMTDRDVLIDFERALESIPRPHREAFTLLCWIGFSADECGRMLRIPPPTVRVHAHRARKALRETMLTYAPSEGPKGGGA